MVTNSIPNFSNRIFNNMMGVPKPASLKRQAQWKTFSPLKKRVEPFLHLDADKDGVPNRWDCQPLNWKRQDFMKTTTVPAYDYPKDYGQNVKRVYMSPKQFLQEIQRKLGLYFQVER